MLSDTVLQNVTYNCVRLIYGYWTVILLEDGVRCGAYREKNCALCLLLFIVFVKLFILMLK
jgi:hypothetical protein